MCVDALREASLTAKPTKFEWGRLHLEYLGHRVGNGQFTVPKHRTDYSQPVIMRDMRAFLRTASYYRKFIDGYSRLSSMLSPATSSRVPGKVTWTPEMLAVFRKLKCSLCYCVMLHVPVISDVFVVHTDASGLRRSPTVIRNGNTLPFSFFSRQLRDAECRYSATELEAQAVLAPVSHFYHYLYGTRFTVVTDHRPLTSLFTSKTLNWFRSSAKAL